MSDEPQLKKLKTDGVAADVAAADINLTIYSMGGEGTFSLTVPGTVSVGDVAQAIQDERGIRRELVNLFVAGAEDALKHGSSLAECVPDNHELFMMLDNHDDRAALEALFRSAGGDTWTIKTGWMGDGDIGALRRVRLPHLHHTDSINALSLRQEPGTG